MGDKGGRKDKDKGQKQKASKQNQKNPITGSILEPQDHNGAGGAESCASIAQWLNRSGSIPPPSIGYRQLLRSLGSQQGPP